MAKLMSALSEIKDSKKPVVLHVHTLKGKGYNYAEKDKEKWHWGLPFDLKTGESKVQVPVDYNELTANYLLKKIKQDSNVVVITSGTPSASAFTKKRRKRQVHNLLMLELLKNTRLRMLLVYQKMVLKRFILFIAHLCKGLMTKYLKTFASIIAQRF